MDNQELIYAVETATVALERIAAALEVIAKVKTVREIEKPKPVSEYRNRYFLYSRNQRERINCGAPCWYTEFKSVENGFQCHKCLKFFSEKEYYC